LDAEQDARPREHPIVKRRVHVKGGRLVDGDIVARPALGKRVDKALCEEAIPVEPSVALGRVRSRDPLPVRQGRRITLVDVKGLFRRAKPPADGSARHTIASAIAMPTRAFMLVRITAVLLRLLGRGAHSVHPEEKP
jgi:hypothetical protein